MAPHAHIRSLPPRGRMPPLRQLDPADHLGTSVVQALLHESA
ncbi:MAG: hypothetical protein Q7S97_11165 [Polaromonas sp.]|nr:hypothetical protein [Polaromonas sp.]